MLLFGEDRIKAIAYYRHSAEDKQENSVEIQREQVEKFALKENIQILEHFQDEGISGLTANRPGFQEMFRKWITNPEALPVDYILVYDASRFGRFQKMEAVWKWLVMCDEKGVKLATVERGLPKGTILDSFVITLDFSSSGEFSKRLSDKVAFGSIKVSEQGFSAGGSAPYGYVRVLLNEQHERIGILQYGEHKIISNQRVKFESAPDETPAVVKRIFHEFVAGCFPDDIAQGLNDDGILTAKGKAWDKEKIVRILTNENYMGTRVYNKTWKRLKAEKARKNPRSQWVRSLNAHAALIDADTFHKAQERLYWLRPRSRNQNVRRIRVGQSYVTKYIEEVIANLSDDQKYYIRRFLPISFGAIYKVQDKTKVCFYIAPRQTLYGEVLLCAIDVETADVGLQSVYKIRESDLQSGGFVLINDAAKITPLGQEELRDTVTNLVSKVVTHHAP